MLNMDEDGKEVPGVQSKKREKIGFFFAIVFFGRDLN